MNRSHVAIYALIAFFIAWIIPDQWIEKTGLSDHTLPPTSFYVKDVEILKVSWNDGRPYVTIKSEHPERMIAITGWSLENELGARGIIRNGVTHVTGIAPEKTAPILIGTGTVAYLLSERSPIGISFAHNICSGYLGGVQEYSPPIPRECPERTLAPGYTNLDVSCTEFLSRVPACETLVPSHAPVSLSPACTAFIINTLTYQGCVALYAKDPNFELPVWHIYLDTTKELIHKSGGNLMLLDKSGKLVDVVSYGPLDTPTP